MTARDGEKKVRAESGSWGWGCGGVVVEGLIIIIIILFTMGKRHV